MGIWEYGVWEYGSMEYGNMGVWSMGVCSMGIWEYEVTLHVCSIVLKVQTICIVVHEVPTDCVGEQFILAESATYCRC